MRPIPSTLAGGSARSNLTGAHLLETVTEVASALLGLVQLIPVLGTVHVPLDEMHSRSRFHDAADLSGLESKGGLFEFLLHLATPKESAVEES